LPVLDGATQVHVRGGHDPNVYRDRGRRADGDYRAILDHPEQLGLLSEGHVAHLVEEQGAAVLFEEAVRTYTGALPVTIFPGAKTSQSDVEAFHRLVEDEFLAIDQHGSLRRLLGHSRTYQTHFNHYRRLLWKVGKTPAQFLIDVLPNDVHQRVTPVALTLPPIVLEDIEPYLHTPGYDVPVLVKETAGPTCNCEGG